MNKYLKAFPIVFIIGVFIIGIFYIGYYSAPEKIKEIKVGTAEQQSLSSMITESCQCPEPELIYEVQGCIDNIDTTSKVKVKNTDEIEIQYEDGTNLKLDGKKYKVKDVPIEVEETTILDYKTLTK